MTHAQILAAAREQIREASDALGQYLAGSEHVFLEAGDRLATLEQRARRLVGASSGAAAIVEGKEGDDPVSRIEEGLANLRRTQAQSREVLQESARKLGRMLAGIDHLARFRHDFERVAVTLWALAINIRVENARGGGGFEAVVADVCRLGALIEPKFEAVLSRAQVLHTTTADALAQAQTFLQHDADKLVAQVEGTATSAAVLRGVRTRASELRAEATAASERIACEIAAVLVELQKHDIARQMIERARAELDGLDQAPDGHDALADVVTVTRRGASQLGRARETLARALTEIAARLSNIAAAAMGLSERTQRMAELREGTSIFERVDLGIEQASAALSEQLARERATTAAMRRVSTAMVDVARKAEEIQAIGSEVKLVAGHAEAQADKKAGDAGRALAALAQSIRELSVDVERQTGKVAVTMGRISEEARTLGAGDATEASQAAATESVAAGMIALLDRLRAQHADVIDMIGAGARAASALHHEVVDLEQKLTAQATRAARIRDLEQSLDRVSAAVEAECEQDPAAAERLRAAVALDTRTRAADTRSPATPAKDGGLGDNVELF